MSDLAIRPHDPRITRAALIGLAVIAGGSFLTAAAKQIAEAPPRYLQPTAAVETPQPGVVAMAVPAPQPTMRVAAAEPPPAIRARRAEAQPEAPVIIVPPPIVAPTLDVAAPVVATPEATPAPAEEAPITLDILPATVPSAPG